MSAFGDRRVRRAILAIGLMLAAVGATQVPSASADPEPIGIGVAHTSATDHSTFSVAAWTDAAGASLTSVTATIRDGSTILATPTLVAADQAGFWTLDAPLELTSDGGVMPHLGRFPIDITAHDDASNSLTRVDAGVLDFTLLPHFVQSNGSALHFTSTLTHADPTTQVTGQLVGVVPGSGDTVPIEGQHVNVTRVYVSDAPPPDKTVTATTDANGSFVSAAFTLVTTGYFHADADVATDTADGTATAPGAAPTAHVQQVYVSAKSNHRRVEPGHKVTISGFVRHGTSASSQGVPGIAVRLTSNGYDGGPQAVATTDANGHFSGTITAVYDIVPGWTADASGYLLDAEVVSGELSVPAEATYRDVSIVLNSNGNITTTAMLGRTYDAISTIYGHQLTKLEASPNGKTGWVVVGTHRSEYDPFTMVTHGYTDAYYRLVHPESKELDSTTTAPVHLSRIPTRIKGNSARPKSVAGGHKVTVTGTLQQHAHGWHAMAHRQIYLFFRKSGSKKWVREAAGKTDAHGHAVLHGTALQSGIWLLQYFGDGKHFDSVGKFAGVTVR
jgi:hypothetical protein